MSGWLALSDREGLVAPEADGVLLACGSFALELALPLPDRTVLLDWRRRTGWERSFTLSTDPAEGLVLLHRQGPRVARHALGAPLVLPTIGLLRLAFLWDAPRRVWEMTVDVPGAPGLPRSVRGADPLPMPAADAAAICAPLGPNLRHPSVLWFGVKADPVRGSAIPWVGPLTPIATPAGPVRAEDLRIGDTVLTERGTANVARLHKAERPGRGSQAPVLLRAPYYATTADLLVSADTAVALHGPAVEYVSGEDCVLVPARHLCDGRSALADPRRAVVTGIALTLDRPGLILAAGCALAPAGPAHDFRKASAAEAAQLMAQLGRIAAA
jgi:hypothetical protein